MDDWKKMREDAGLTVQQLAAMAGYSVGTVSDLENHGKGSKRLRALLREILQGAKISVSELSEKSRSGRKEPDRWVGQIDLTILNEDRLSDLQDFYNTESRRADVEPEHRHNSLKSLRAVVMELERRAEFKGVDPKIAAGLSSLDSATDEEAERRLREKRSRQQKHKTGAQSGARDERQPDGPESSNQQPPPEGQAPR